MRTTVETLKAPCAVTQKPVPENGSNDVGNTPAASIQAATVADALEAHAEAIKAIRKRAIDNVIDIGRHLIEAKKICGYGYWLPWLRSNFGWTDRTARNFMQIYECFKSEKFSDLNLPVSSLYLLAAPSTPKEVRDAVIERAEAGELISHNQVKTQITKARASTYRKRHRGDSRRRTTSEAPAKDKADFDLDLVCLKHTFDIEAAAESMSKDQRVQFVRRLQAVLAKLVASISDDDIEIDETIEGGDRARAAFPQ